MSHLETIQEILKDITKKDIEITPETDLALEGVLDSLDGMMFFMALDEKLGLSIPEDIDLKAEGYFKVSKLLGMLEGK